MPAKSRRPAGGNLQFPGSYFSDDGSCLTLTVALHRRLVVFVLPLEPFRRARKVRRHRRSELPGPSPCPINLTYDERPVDFSHVEALRFCSRVVPMAPGGLSGAFCR